jgi:serine-type D-Ala-D-Ala carboxypeptidase/endopeptidase
MPHRRAFLLGAIATFGGLARASAETPPDEAIHAILKQRIDVDQHGTGIVAGVLDASGRRLIAYGRPDTPDERALDGDTVFEIGSITKVFTALLLADMVHRGEVALADPVARYLPAEVKMPERGGKAITLLDLATYSSGLPNMPGNLHPNDPANLFADYTLGQLYSFLSNYTLLFDPGSHYEYANLGFGLLGHALARRAGQSYEELVIARICEPLGLESTRIALTPSMRPRKAQGHDVRRRLTPDWLMPTLAGAGALNSTASDLLMFLENCLGQRDTPLAPAMKMMLDTRRLGEAGMIAALGWFISTQHGDEIVSHAGGTRGFSSFVAFSTISRRGCVFLSNGQGLGNLEQFGFHLLNAGYPLFQKS